QRVTQPSVLPTKIPKAQIENVDESSPGFITGPGVVESKYTTTSISPFRFDLLAVFGAILLLGTTLILTRIAIALVNLRRMRARSQLATDPRLIQAFENVKAARLTRRSISLRTSDQIESPVSFGFFRPTIVLPERLSNSALDTASIIAHEVMHVSRCDFLIGVMMRFARAFLFYHPIIHLISKRANILREVACDDGAVAFASSRSEYAAQLLSMNGALSGKSMRLQLEMSTSSNLVDRIEEMSRSSGHSAYKPRVKILATLLIIVSFAAMSTVSCSSGDDDSQKACEPWYGYTYIDSVEFSWDYYSLFGKPMRIQNTEIITWSYELITDDTLPRITEEEFGLDGYLRSRSVISPDITRTPTTTVFTYANPGQLESMNITYSIRRNRSSDVVRSYSYVQEFDDMGNYRWTGRLMTSDDVVHENISQITLVRNDEGLVTERIEVEERDGELEKTTHSLFTYDEYGNVVAYQTFLDNELSETTTKTIDGCYLIVESVTDSGVRDNISVYDMRHHALLELTRYRADGVALTREEYVYHKFDKTGNWTNMTKTEYKNRNGELWKELATEHRREIRYW
ncbi:MAG: M56 family metallopeptidase, partial [Spirochaetales bacterium]|nr:M56 family metallopeptidase [Spirochaetales bacterium]